MCICGTNRHAQSGTTDCEVHAGVSPQEAPRHAKENVALRLVQPSEILAVVVVVAVVTVEAVVVVVMVVAVEVVIKADELIVNGILKYPQEQLVATLKQAMVP